MLKIEDLKFDEKGLIPAIVVDAENGRQPRASTSASGPQIGIP